MFILSKHRTVVDIISCCYAGSHKFMRLLAGSLQPVTPLERNLGFLSAWSRSDR